MTTFSRRKFIKTAAAAAVLTSQNALAAAPHQATAGEAGHKKSHSGQQNWFNYTSTSGVQTLSIWSPYVKENIHLFVISDTHLFETDERNLPYQQFSARMAKAYNSVPHHDSRQPTTPAAALRESFEIARSKQPDAIVHLGDLVSFPSEYSIEYAAGLIKEYGMPFYYISGNHDWCYEGFESDPGKHRSIWLKRLEPFYPEDVNPLQYSVTVKGVKLIFIDDSTGDITQEQIEFFRKEVSENVPSILMMHIGLFFPGHENFYLGFPDFIPTLSADGKLKMISPKDGSHATNIELFWSEVVRANKHNNLLSLVVGHNHIVKAEEVGPLRQFVVPLNADGSYTDLYIHPATATPDAEKAKPVPGSSLGWS